MWLAEVAHNLLDEKRKELMSLAEVGHNLLDEKNKEQMWWAEVGQNQLTVAVVVVMLLCYSVYLDSQMAVPLVAACLA